MEISEFKE